MSKTRAPKPKSPARHERFLSEMEQVAPWPALLEALEPSYYPNAAAGRRGRPPVGLERMSRMYFLQQETQLGDYTVLHQKWWWDGITAESPIFANEDLGDNTAQRTHCRDRPSLRA